MANFRIKVFLCSMNYLVLGCKIEYEQAAKRLEELTYAQPGTLEAQERKELLNLFIRFEQDIKAMFPNSALGYNKLSVF